MGHLSRYRSTICLFQTDLSKPSKCSIFSLPSWTGYQRLQKKFWKEFMTPTLLKMFQSILRSQESQRINTYAIYTHLCTTSINTNSNYVLFARCYVKQLNAKKEVTEHLYKYKYHTTYKSSPMLQNLSMKRMAAKY
jgi:hypothetical protein